MRCAADGPLRPQRVGLCGNPARHGWGARDRHQRAVTADELFAQGRERGALLGDGPPESIRAAEITAESLPRRGSAPARSVRASERKDTVAVGEKLGDDDGADTAPAPPRRTGAWGSPRR